MLGSNNSLRLFAIAFLSATALDGWSNALAEVDARSFLGSVLSRVLSKVLDSPICKACGCSISVTQASANKTASNRYRVVGEMSANADGLSAQARVDSLYNSEACQLHINLSDVDGRQNNTACVIGAKLLGVSPLKAIKEELKTGRDIKINPDHCAQLNSQIKALE
jgi:hypothetical protein